MKYKSVNAKFESELLKKLGSSTGGDYKETLVDLVQLYRRTRKVGKAFEYINRMLYIYESWNGTEHGPFPPNLFKNEWFNYVGQSSRFYLRRGNTKRRPYKDWEYSINDCFSYCLDLLGRDIDADPLCQCK